MSKLMPAGYFADVLKSENGDRSGRLLYQKQPVYGPFSNVLSPVRKVARFPSKATQTEVREMAVLDEKSRDPDYPEPQRRMALMEMARRFREVPKKGE